MPRLASSFWLDSRQRTWLRRLRETWGEDVVVQIYGGSVRLRGDDGDWRFASKTELQSTTLRHRRQSQSATQ